MSTYDLDILMINDLKTTTTRLKKIQKEFNECGLTMNFSVTPPRVKIIPGTYINISHNRLPIYRDTTMTRTYEQYIEPTQKIEVI
jgi:hypothetical protein